MRKTITMLGFMILMAAGPASADTIYLKNGSIIKGKVASFSDEQFVVILNTGSDRMSSRAQIYSGDVAKIDFDSSAGTASLSGPADSGPSVTGPTIRTTVDNGPAATSNQPTTTTPKSDETSAGASAETSPPATADKDRNQPPPSEAEPPPQVKKAKGQARSATVDVIAKRDWTSSGLIVRRGDTIRISAAGTVTLDPNTGQTSGPEGIDQPDPKKLMADKPTGSLIAVIGADNDDFIFIGRSAEFTAARDGLLFLSVNEGTLSDNSGSFKATIEVESNRK